jgi:hypothetical protein
MWLKTIMVADITTADGRRITPHAWNGTRASMQQFLMATATKQAWTQSLEHLASSTL